MCSLFCNGLFKLILLYVEISIRSKQKFLYLKPNLSSDHFNITLQFTCTKSIKYLLSNEIRIKKNLF